MAPTKGQTAAAEETKPAAEAAAINADVNNAPQPRQGNGRVLLADNVWGEMFEGIAFKPSSGTLYKNTDGSKTKQIASGVVTFRGGFGTMKIRVQQYQPAGGKSVARVSFVSARGIGSTIEPLTAKADKDLIAFLRHAGTLYQAWRKQAGPDADKATADTGVEMDLGDL